jgi:hypothetical protein
MGLQNGSDDFSVVWARGFGNRLFWKSDHAVIMTGPFAMRLTEPWIETTFMKRFRKVVANAHKNQ